MAVLLARRLEAGPSRPAWQERIADFAPALAAAAIALWVASADTKLANSARTAAAFFQQKTRGEQGTLWFQGHWGFQNYMEAIGAHPIDVSARRLRSGDLVVIPLNNTNTFPFRQDQIASQEPFDFPIDAWLATMRSGRAGFYADVWGPLPFSFGAVPAERYLLLRLEAQVPANGPAPPR